MSLLQGRLFQKLRVFRCEMGNQNLTKEWRRIARGRIFYKELSKIKGELIYLISCFQQKNNRLKLPNKKIQKNLGVKKNLGVEESGVRKLGSNWGHYVASLIMLWVLGFKYPFNSSYSI